jgi:hypothetical protein
MDPNSDLCLHAHILYRLVTVSHLTYCSNCQLPWLDCLLLSITWYHWLSAATESKSYITINGQSTSLSWNKAPIWGLRPDFYYCQTVVGLLIWGALSDERTALSLWFLLALTSVVILRSQSLGTRDHILLSQIWDFPFHCLVRLARLRWRYSTPPPHGIATNWWFALVI